MLALGNGGSEKSCANVKKEAGRVLKREGLLVCLQNHRQAELGNELHILKVPHVFWFGQCSQWQSLRGDTSTKTWCLSVLNSQ